MRNYIAKLAVSFALLNAGLASSAQFQQAQEQRQDQDTDQRRLASQLPHRREYVVPETTERPVARNDDANTTANSYDPLAGRHRYQGKGGFWDGVLRDLNPCGKNLGFALDGWQDLGLEVTIKSYQCWLAAVLFAALAGVSVDDFFRARRAENARVAFAAAALVMMNDCGRAIDERNDAVYRHNVLVEKIDRAALELQDQTRTEIHMAARSAAIQAAEVNANDSINASPKKPEAPNEALVSPLAAPVAAHVAPITEAQTGPKDAGNDAETGTSGPTEDDPNAQITTLEMGGKKYKVPLAVRLAFQAKERQVQSQRIRINQLEERLRQYEKE
jgi:hypothetical protein